MHQAMQILHVTIVGAYIFLLIVNRKNITNVLHYVARSNKQPPKLICKL